MAMDVETRTLRFGAGALAGLAGTMALQGLRTASQMFLPETMAPIREEPGAFMIDRAEEALDVPEEKVPEAAETAAATALAMGYGALAGALYGALRPPRGNVILDGSVLGVGIWAVGYLGWLPSLGLMPPVSDQPAKQAVPPVVRHALYGIATVAAYKWLCNRFW